MTNKIDDPIHREYRVTWEIDVSAESPEHAADLCRTMQLDEESAATLYRVKDDDGISAIYETEGEETTLFSYEPFKTYMVAGRKPDDISDRIAIIDAKNADTAVAIFANEKLDIKMTDWLNLNEEQLHNHALIGKVELLDEMLKDKVVATYEIE